MKEYRSKTSSSPDAEEALGTLHAVLDTQEAQATLQELALEEQRTVLDPPDLASIIGRILKLSQRAEGQNTDEVLAPGLELLSRVASELRLHLPPYASGRRDPIQRGDLKSRHRDALERVIPASLLFATYCALSDAARLGYVEDDLHEGVTQDDADRLALDWVRRTLGARLPPVDDATLLEAVRIFRRRRQPRGRPKKGAKLSTDLDRAQGVIVALRLDGRDPASVVTQIDNAGRAASDRTAVLLGSRRKNASNNPKRRVLF